MIRRRLVTLFSLISLVGLMLGLGACTTGSGGGGSDSEATPTPIPTSIVPTSATYTVQRGDVVELLQFSGRIAPVTEEELFFKTGGYVAAVYAARNDAVKKGDLLAELEVTDLNNQITQAKAELQSVQMNYVQQVTQAGNNVRAAELRLAKLQASTNESQMVSARISLENARARLANAQDEYNKSLDRSWEREDVRQAYAQAVHDAESGVEMAQAQFDEAVQASERNAYDIELAQMDLNLSKLQETEVQAGLDVTRTQLSLQRLQDQLSDARIVAPFDGVILELNILEGTQVQGYNPVFLLADPSQLEISADLQDSQMSQLTEGMPVVAEFTSHPGTQLAGVIRRLPYPYSGGGQSQGLQTTQDQDQSTRITLQGVDPVAAGYRIGDRLNVTIELDRSVDTLWLPPQAVRTFEGRSFVVVQEQGVQRRVDVRLGIVAQDRVEIVDGLTEGQVVVAP